MSESTNTTSGVSIGADVARADSSGDSHPAESCALILFGITGDLAARKILPALLDLEQADALPAGMTIIGFSRSAGDDESLRARLREAVAEHRPDFAPEIWARFVKRIFAAAGSASDPAAYAELGRRLIELERTLDSSPNRLVYLATPPSAFAPIIEQLNVSGIVQRGADGSDGAPWQRVIIEKPFGRDLASARSLQRDVDRFLTEGQVFRIDHFLGKETVQNILVFRFGNAIFEPLWNRNHVDQVQITVAESIGVEGRAAFYEETGIVRDMVQNHLLQMLSLCAMEAPVDFRADEIRNMKAQIFRSLRPMLEHEVDDCVVAGQYEGYLEHDDVPEASRTPTYIAIRAFIDNWRWQGVPFYLRTGKGLKARSTEISIHFRSIPFCLFGEERVCQFIEPNVLKLRIQPDEGITLRVASKIPGDSSRVGSVKMNFNYADTFECEAPDAYQRLLLDGIRGDATLFARADEVDLCWQWVEPILERWKEGPPKLESYERGGLGPEAAAQLLRERGHRWLPLEAEA